MIALRALCLPLGNNFNSFVLTPDFPPPDINECLNGSHNCATGKVCINTQGSFRCRRERSCGTGYELWGDSCKGNSLTVAGNATLSVNTENVIFFLYATAFLLQTSMSALWAPTTADQTLFATTLWALFAATPRTSAGAASCQTALAAASVSVMSSSSMKILWVYGGKSHRKSHKPLSHER